MNYLIVYNIHYIHDEASTPEESLKEIKDNLEQIKRIKDRELLESIYDIAQKYRQF
jgi:mannitol/fructose-specific phosphotransferase system IIA component (Ntr-type)